MNSILENGEHALAALGALYVLVSYIAYITPSDKDNTFLEKVGKWADRIGLNVKGK